MKRLFSFFVYLRHPRGLSAATIRPGAEDAYFHCFGLLVNWRALWVGAHYSKHDKRLCLNLLPCVTLWWTKPGGKLP